MSAAQAEAAAAAERKQKAS
ncbi:hypothetical protein L195_g060025, partial [Trifolium pratense]